MLGRETEAQSNRSMQQMAALICAEYCVTVEAEILQNEAENERDGVGWKRGRRIGMWRHWWW